MYCAFGLLLPQSVYCQLELNIGPVQDELFLGQGQGLSDLINWAIQCHINYIITEPSQAKWPRKCSQRLPIYPITLIFPLH